MTTEHALTKFDPENLDQAEKLAVTLSKSALLPDALRGKPADILVTLIAGRELGLSPMQAIRSMYVVKGKPVLSSDLMVALVKRHPECVYFKMLESSDTVARYATERKGEGKTEMAFTIQQAQQAGLSNGDNWKKYPAAMLRARCSSALARVVFPDLTLGVCDPDEAKEFSGEAPTTPPPQVAEKDVTPANGKGNDAVKAKLRAKAAPVIVDVQPGQTEEQAEDKARKARIWAKAQGAGITTGTFTAWVNGVLGRNVPTAKWSVEDMGQLEHSLLQPPHDPVTGEVADDIPFPSDADAPGGVA